MSANAKRIALGVLCLAMLLSLGRVGSVIWAADPAAGKPDEIASAEQFKAKAIAALRAGKFEQTNDYLAKAAELSNDPAFARMANWTKQFENQWQGFVAERHKEFEKATGDVHKLLTTPKYVPYAMQLAVRAHSLADDKEAFRKEPRIAQLLEDAKKLADDSEKSEQWLRAFQLYMQLGAIEPEMPQWKEKLKIATRRIRVIGLYAPEELRKIQNKDRKDREEVEALLKPAADASQSAKTPVSDGDSKKLYSDVRKANASLGNDGFQSLQGKSKAPGKEGFKGGEFTPTGVDPDGNPISPVPAPAKDNNKDSNKPTVEIDPKSIRDAEDVQELQNRIKWQDALRGVRMDMLRDAILRAREDYYREVSYQRMLLGGLNSLRVVLTTPALEKAVGFDGFKNVAKRNQFLGFVDANISRLEKQGNRDDQESVVELLRNLREQNDSTVELPEEALVSEFADGAFAMLDEFSNIMWPMDWEELQKDTRGEFSGVGIQIQSDEHGDLKVVTPLEDSPAYRAGVKPDYIVTHIDHKDAKWINVTQAVKQITGAPGTKVVLTIKDTKGNPKDYQLTRETIKVASVKGWMHKPGGGWDYMIDPEQKIGYVRLIRFSRTTSEDLNKAVAELKAGGATAIIMDLRYNGGGLLPAAIDVVDKFISEGTIVSTRPDRADSPNQPTVAVAHRQRSEVELPMVVLVNQLSASASEIVSGALKDHHRAIVIGERTFGKGSVQMLYPLRGESAVLKLTTSHYYLPNGKCIHREENSKDWGVDPDILVEMTPEQMSSAIQARQDSEILRDADQPNAEKPADSPKAETAKKAKDPLAVDPQLSVALLVLRLQLAGAAL